MVYRECKVVSNYQLPKNFVELERFTPEWVHHSERQRNQFRVNQDLKVLNDFYETVLPKLHDIAAEVDKYPLDALPMPQANLLALALMFMEVAPAVEYYNAADVPNAVAHAQFEIYDLPAAYQWKN